jgi:hypothetical protein
MFLQAFRSPFLSLLQIHLALFLSLSVGVASACQEAALREANAQSVQNCSYLNQVEGSSGYGKTLNWRGFAKHAALHRAKRSGATHIVWEKLVPVGAFNGIAIGRSYRCRS